MNGDLAADALTALVGEASPRLALAALFVITTLLGLFISNTATRRWWRRSRWRSRTSSGHRPTPSR
jgi:hypothetical protein